MKAAYSSPALLWMDHEVSQELHTQNDKSRGGKRVKCSNGHFINLKGNALSDKGAPRIEESPGPLLHTL